MSEIIGYREVLNFSIIKYYHFYNKEEIRALNLPPLAVLFGSRPKNSYRIDIGGPEFIMIPCGACRNPASALISEWNEGPIMKTKLIISKAR